MTYTQVIESLASNILTNFDEVYHSAEIITAGSDKFPGIAKADEWISLAPTDQRETIYIRRNGDDEVVEELKIGSCGKSYKMRSSLRVVYFKDHTAMQILPRLMQSVLINGTRLSRVIQDKWRLQKDESSGDYNFGANTAYFAIDIFALWYLIPDTCEQDYCLSLENPFRKCEVTQENS